MLIYYSSMIHPHPDSALFGLCRSEFHRALIGGLIGIIRTISIHTVCNSIPWNINKPDYFNYYFKA